MAYHVNRHGGASDFTERFGKDYQNAAKRKSHSRADDLDRIAKISMKIGISLFVTIPHVSNIA